MFILNEDSRKELVARSKLGQPEKGDGKTRYEKRLKSRVANSTKQYNRINMDELFKKDILTINIEVTGETDNYLVKISFGGFLKELQSEIDRNNGNLDLRNIIKALIISFNKDDVYIMCTCPDWKYRFGYWATKTNISSGEPELIPSDETNPDNKLGPACKHVLLVLSNTSWLIKVASVINNYIKYMEKYRNQQYAKFIYPSLYKQEYNEPIQQNIYGEEEIETDQELIDKSNEEGRVRGRFSSEHQPIRNPSIRKARQQEDEKQATGQQKINLKSNTKENEIDEQ